MVYVPLVSPMSAGASTVEAKVRDDEGSLVALETGAFRIFEKRGDPIA